MRVSNVLKKQSSFQKTEKILKSINKKSTSRLSIAETKTRREKTDYLLIWREKADFPRGMNIKMAVGFSRKKKKNASQKRVE